MLTMLTCWWWAGVIHHFTTHVVYVLWQYMKVRVSPNLLQFIRSYLRDFWGKVKRSSVQVGRVHTAGDSDLSLRSEQKERRLVCSSVSVDLMLFKWHKRAAGLRRICGNLIWFALQTSHFGFGSNLQKWLHILCFLLPKIDLGTSWIC